MDDEDDENACQCDAGAGWVMTFADLMSLLMSFFVLLLSFSEMDVIKFKQIAGSLKTAFGVQREIKLEDAPKGTSVIKQEFSPGRPTPTLLDQIRQQASRAAADQAQQEIEQQAEQLKEALAKEIRAGQIDVEAKPDGILIRIQQEGSFPSGGAGLRDQFKPVLDRIADKLKASDSTIVVSGHTDDVPIDTARFPSNWYLSAARAANVVHHFTQSAGLDPKRIAIRAYADTSPLVPNDSAANRARNRRVEILIKDDDGNVSSDSDQLGS